MLYAKPGMKQANHYCIYPEGEMILIPSHVNSQPKQMELVATPSKLKEI